VPTGVWIAGAVLAVIVALIVLSSGGSEGPATVTASDEELDYLGRFLPEGYSGPEVAERTLYTSAFGMSSVSGVQEEGSVSIPLASVVQDKIVRFDYERADGQVLPMLAYVKPSGSLFVGVNYCPPCEGEGQRIESDGTLTCESCGTKRDLETNVGISGACSLYPLDEVPASVVGDQVVVDGAVLDGWTPQPLDRPVG
jgi:hypothetical protein